MNNYKIELYCVGSSQALTQSLKSLEHVDR